MPMPDGGSADPGADFAAALRAAIASRGTTLAHLHRRLIQLGTPVGLTTLSYWRSGKRRPDAASRAVLAHLERELDLAPGALSGLLAGDPAVDARGGGVTPANPASSGRPSTLHAGTPRAGTPRAGTFAPVEGLDARARALLYGAQAPESSRGLRDDSVQHVLDVDADGRPQRLRVRCLHRATRSGVDRRVVLLVAGAGDGEPGPFVALAGGRIGARARDRQAGLYAAEFCFDRTLRRGETVVIEYEVELGLVEEHYYELVIVRRLRHAMLWIRFTPGRVPRQVEVYREARGRRSVRPADMTGTTSVHHTISDAVDGQIGVRWSQPD